MFLCVWGKVFGGMDKMIVGGLCGVSEGLLDLWNVG